MMNGFNQYICDFCQKPCKRSISCARYGKNARWQRCTNCIIEVLFAVNVKGAVQCIMFLPPDIDNKENLYRISIDFGKNETKVCYLEKQTCYENNRKRKSWRSKHLLELNKCISNVTPENVMDKINFLLVLS